MIFGLEPQVFFTFLIWPVVYPVIAIIMYFVMAKNDKKEAPIEEENEKWLKEYNAKKAAEGGEGV